MKEQKEKKLEAIRVDPNILERVRRKTVNTPQTIKEFYDLAALTLLSTNRTTHYRSAKTGRYVKKKFAEMHPNTTEKETDVV